MMNTSLLLPYNDHVEQIPVDEAEDITKIVQVLELILARSQAKSGKFLSDVRVKTHANAQREFRVLPNLPSTLARITGHIAEACLAFWFDEGPAMCFA